MTSITQLKFCDCSQLNMIAGRTLEVEFAHDDKTGETIFIMVDRRNPLQTALDEASCLHDFRKPLEVQIYNEVMFLSKFLLILSGLLQHNTLAQQQEHSVFMECSSFCCSTASCRFTYSIQCTVF